MASGDGLIVRVRPMLGRLTARQASGLCAAASRHGSGVIELTSRANLQIRGVTEGGRAALISDLRDLGLLDADPRVEARRNVIVSPLWQHGDATQTIAKGLLARLADLPALPALPAKFGFAVDAGDAPLLSDASADIRVERCVEGGLMVRLDGAERGRPVAAAAATDAIVEMARWFAAHRGAAGRARDLTMAPPADWRGAQAASPATLTPGPSPIGAILGAPFGQIPAAALADAMRRTGAAALRLAPGRLFLLEGGRPVPDLPFATAPGDPLLAVDACPGAPACAAASVETRTLARALAGRLTHLHVSGCAKGCARPRPAAVTLVGRDGRFDLVRNGTAWDSPAWFGLTPEQILAEADRL